MLDDLVFLPANLTRLLIDPYREECLTEAHIGMIGRTLRLDIPWVIGGLDFSGISDSEARAIALGASKTGCAVRVPAAMAPHFTECRTMVCLKPGEELCGGNPEAIEISGVTADTGEQTWFSQTRNQNPSLPIGTLAEPGTAADAVEWAVRNELDFVTVMATSGTANGVIAEDSLPEISTLAEAVETARRLRAEEKLSIVYGGYIWCGADAARVMALGASAVMLSSAVRTVLAAASTDYPEEMAEYLTRFLVASTQEISMLARVCGKTRTRNLEPEDMRSLTTVTSAATGIPLVGSDRIYR